MRQQGTGAWGTITADLGPWSPLTLPEVAALFSAPSPPWPTLTRWMSGGEALDLFVGHRTREHEDIDVSILRSEAIRLPPIFPGWNLHLAHAGTLTPWDGRPIGPPFNSLWCRRHDADPWSLQIMLEDGTRERWVCRRFPELSLPTAEVVWHTPDGLPFMAPHVQLFMKAKDHRPKDDADFALVSPLLSPDHAVWLTSALTRFHPGHAWLA